MTQQILSTASRRKIPQTSIFVGGEDLPSYAENFLYSLASNGFLTVRVNAREAKTARENAFASNDSLDLLGTGKTMLAKRAVTVVKPFEIPQSEHAEVYNCIRELSLSRGRIVKSQTSVSNQIHTYVDRLLPGFLDSSKSAIHPFSKASLALMKNEFSSVKIGRKKCSTLAGQLRKLGTQYPDDTAAKLIALAKGTLLPNQALVPTRQRVLTPLVEQYENFEKAARAMKVEASIHLASTPYAFLTSIPGIALTISNGFAGELGAPSRLPAVKSICGYGGVVPRSDQTGGPDSEAKLKSSPRRCNRVFKHWLMQAVEKVNQFGPVEWKDRAGQWEANGQHTRFLSARSFLRVSKVLVCRQTTFQCRESLAPNAGKPVRAADAEVAYRIMVNKWKEVPQWQEVAFGDDTPLGKWRNLMIELFDADLPLSKR
ncbi:MAG: transposase [Verrucomicrobiales bacterium]|nr:transposase [Verrucomicrobiales bacterium]